MQVRIFRRLALLLFLWLSPLNGQAQDVSKTDHPAYGRKPDAEVGPQAVYPSDDKPANESGSQRQPGPETVPPPGFYWDTLAQWAMAVTSAIAVALIWGTFRQSQKTLREAQRSTDAAEKSVKETRRVGEAQVRAYVTMPRLLFRIDYTECSFIIRPTFQNAGHSPTREIAIYVSFLLKQLPVTGQTKPLAEPHGQSITHTIYDLVPENPVNTEIKAKLPPYGDVVFDNEFPKMIEIETMAIFVDVFGYRREERFTHLATIAPGNDMTDYIEVRPVPPFLRKDTEENQDK
jgi:hypothetical protein